ncbi:peroxiredoxin [Granulicella aggregans]|uniref:thioredoxin-dependent peroxiredoxin n=1 Tax=Granulicella aggregans TaxID=474949 RepID=A0A7W7ZD27_9BACT|nr:peroxiredoxin family protein [Granulicella aggregans]MBB5057577.1 peroxiredoxin [Granulicella aggregans]
MSLQRKIKFLALPALLLAFWLLQPRSFAATPAVGEKAADFTLKTPDGQPVRLFELTGNSRVVLIVLRGYPGYQCPYCVRQVHDVIEHAAEFQAAKAEVLLVYPGPPAELDQHAKEFLAKQNPLPAGVHLVIDPDYSFTNLYGLRWNAEHETAYPSTFIIDGSKTVVFRKVSKGHGDRTNSAEILSELKQAR